MKMNLPQGGTLGQLESACTTLLEEIGENPDREGLLRTPERFAASMLELTRGYQEKLEDVVNGALFASPSREMVLVRRIEFYSLCEHHLLPFFGFAHIAYVPNGKIIGLSKIPRIVNMFARRLQLQERLTAEVCDALQQALQTKDIACVMEGAHLCMMMRGIESQNARLTTTAFRGAFGAQGVLRDQFFQMISLEKDERLSTKQSSPDTNRAQSE